jgi:hypothetical protein
VYQTARAVWLQPKFGCAKTCVWPMVMFGWSSSYPFTFASSVSNPAFLIEFPDLTLNVFNLTHASSSWQASG